MQQGSSVQPMDWLLKFRARWVTLQVGLRIISLTVMRRALGFRALVDSRFNCGQADEDHVRLPVIPVQILKNILLVRGLFHNNYLFSGLAKCCMNQIEYALQGMEPRQPKELPRININDIDPIDFYERFVKVCRPVILTGVRYHKDSWSLAELKRLHSATTVMMTDLKTGQTSRQKLAALFDQGVGDRLYVHNCESLWAADRFLLKSLFLGQFSKFLRREMKCAQIFLGMGADTGTDMHCANNFNIFFQLKGAKRWRFVNPEYTPLVFPVVGRSNGYFASLVSRASDADQNAEIQKIFKYCPRYEAVIHEGEVLLNPPLWWHSVSVVPETPETISVSTRWGAPALATIFGDRNNAIDCVETNHLFTSLQLPGVLRNLYSSIVHEVRQRHGQTAKGALWQLESLETEFEKNAHDDMPEEIASGKIFKAFGITRSAKDFNQVPPQTLFQ